MEGVNQNGSSAADLDSEAAKSDMNELDANAAAAPRATHPVDTSKEGKMALEAPLQTASCPAGSAWGGGSDAASAPTAAGTGPAGYEAECSTPFPWKSSVTPQRRHRGTT